MACDDEGSDRVVAVTPREREQIRQYGGDRPALVIAADIAAMGYGDECLIGLMGTAAVRIWGARSRLTVLTAERRDHYLAKRPEMARYHADVVRVVRDPDEIHSYPGNLRSATCWRKVDNDHDVYVAVFMSETDERKNSVITAVYARAKEFERRRHMGLSVWTRGDDEELRGDTSLVGQPFPTFP